MTDAGLPKTNQTPVMRNIRVTVVLALPDAATEMALTMPQGTSLLDAIKQSGILANVPQTGVDAVQCGIWGRHASHATILVDGDRVEIYRPLIADPKRVRRVRALKRFQP